MKFRDKLSTLFLLAFLCLYAGSVSAETVIPDRPLNHVVDLAGIIDAAVEASLNRYLLELEQKTTAQMLILTITSLEGQSIDDLSLDIAHNRWKLGQKGKDNGMLLLVSFQDRKYRFETGYGLEGAIPDSLSGSIGRQYLVPYFQKGDYSSGIAAATLAVINIIADEAGVEIAGMPKMRISAERQKKPTLPGTILSILFLIGLIYLFIKHPRLLMLLLVANVLGGGRRSGWGGGGGFGGGGSFGGGGGGGFGGGGSSGGW